ncbi:hypothetical protein TW65_08543 [Stemphylium lycopersici]|uniref:Uncharacterized protein n=1 Tax=Stemphylium lycopersici TaxID=183478 RepID=A0A364NES1_STELY|nr:hypothetical protein TW65_08543 [Stemphylium lycopersici]RAR15799.1 hypothetical protein DDE83_000815 [Stemphylium lycopersici]
MESNVISGMVLDKRTARHYVELLQTLYNTIIYALDRDNKCGLASQTQITWAVRAARRPDPLDEEITTVKSKIQSFHVGFYEEWKVMKYESRIKWPVSPNKGSLWNTFARAMDQDRPIYEMRNWFSHEFGKRTATLEEENEKFEELLQEYIDFLPSLSSLLKKLEAALNDEAVWAPESAIKARQVREGQPEYMRDSKTVQEELAAEHQRWLERMKQEEVDAEARLAQVKANLEDPWACEEWEKMKQEGEEWGSSDPGQPWASPVEGDEDLWDAGSDEEEEEKWSMGAEDLLGASWDMGNDEHECAEGLQDEASLCDAGYISGYISVARTATYRLPSHNATTKANVVVWPKFVASTAYMLHCAAQYGHGRFVEHSALANTLDGTGTRGQGGSGCCLHHTSF